MNKLLGILLAGGKGQRLKQLTRELPKPLVPYAAQCRMIDFSLQNCVDSGVQEVMLLSKHMETLIHQYLLAEWTHKIKIHFGPYQALHHQPAETVYASVQKPDEQGTADALLNGREYIYRDGYEDVLILHSDHIYHYDFKKMYELHQSSKAALTIGYQEIPLEYVKLFGMSRFDTDGNLVEFVEKPANPTANTVFTAVCIFNIRLMYQYLDQLKHTEWRHDISHDLIPAMLRNGEIIKGICFEDYWEDIGTTERFYKAHLNLVNGKIRLLPPQTLSDAKEVRLIDDEKRNRVLADSRVIRVDFKAENSVIFPGARIGEQCFIKNSVIMPDAELPAGTHISNALVSQGHIEYFH